MPTLPKINTTQGSDTSAADHMPHNHVTIYEGTKNFWRTRENVDVKIIEHIDQNVIEIISFSVEKYVEGDRLFLDAPMLYKKVDNNEIEEKLKLKREELNRQRKRVPNEELKVGLLRKAALDYFLTRLVPTTTKVPLKSANGRKLSPTTVAAAAETSDTQETSTSTAESGETTQEGPVHTTSTVEAGENSEAAVANDSAGTVVEPDPPADLNTDKPPVVAAPSLTELAEPRFTVDLSVLTGLSLAPYSSPLPPPAAASLRHGCPNHPYPRSYDVHLCCDSYCPDNRRRRQITPQDEEARDAARGPT